MVLLNPETLALKQVGLDPVPGIAPPLPLKVWADVENKETDKRMVNNKYLIHRQV
jgi:hypothetical protein